MIPFNKNWLFFRGDICSPNQRGFTKAGIWTTNGAYGELDDSQWQKVDLPHDYVFEGDFIKYSGTETSLADIPEMGTIDSLLAARGSLPCRPAWYRKHFSLPEGSEGKKVYIHFGGICRNADVYLNQFRVTNHLNGFLDFSVDVTELLNDREENILAVRVDPSETEGWWYQGGGIYRNVWLDIKEPVHFSKDSLWVCPEVDYVNKKATIQVEAVVENHTNCKIQQDVKIRIYAPDKKLVYEKSDVITVSNMDKEKIKTSLELEQIMLWDCDHPQLYQVELGISNGERISCSTGFRHLYFDKNTGFWLNGVPTKLKGTCVHQGHACVGVGEFDGLHEFKIKKLKEMGSNAYRTAHHPVSKELLDACDRLGMLVMDETRLMSTGEEDRAIFEQMIVRDRNHPSVIMWSIGNEEVGIQFTDYAQKICRRMTDIAHKLDPTRPTTEALLYWDSKEKVLRTNTEIGAPVADNVDVVGINYGLPVWQNLRNSFPHKPFVSPEVGSLNSTRGAVAKNPDRCQVALDHSIEKGENSWKQTAELAYCMGMFAWTGFDYYGEPTPYTYPAVIGQFGIYDACGFPKYSYYYYKVNWREDVDTFALCPHWNYVQGGEKRTVYLFTQCDEAELFVNGVSKGRVAIEKYSHGEWKDIDFEPGEIMAVGYKNGRETNRTTVATTGPACRLTAQTENISVDVNDIMWVIISLSVLDKEGREVPTADNKVRICPGENVILAGAGNGDPMCHENSKSLVRSLFAGKAQVILRRDAAVQKGRVTFSADGMNEVTIEF